MGQHRGTQDSCLSGRSPRSRRLVGHSGYFHCRHDLLLMPLTPPELRAGGRYGSPRIGGRGAILLPQNWGPGGDPAPPELGAGGRSCTPRIGDGRGAIFRAYHSRMASLTSGTAAAGTSRRGAPSIRAVGISEGQSSPSASRRGLRVRCANPETRSRRSMRASASGSTANTPAKPSSVSGSGASSSSVAGRASSNCGVPNGVSSASYTASISAKRC